MKKENTKKKTLNLLFIDDHKLILQGYETVLKTCEEYKINFHSKTNIKDAYSHVVNHKKDKFDIIFFDVGMGKKIEAYEDEDHTGVELACRIRKYTSYPKIAFITGHSDFYLFEQIMQKLNANGIIVKDELDIEDLKYAVKKIIDGAGYFSDSALDNLMKRASNKRTIDDIDVKILYYMSIGIQSKDLGDKIEIISQSAVEKRKLKIKGLFEIENYSDFAMVKEAKRRGLI